MHSPVRAASSQPKSPTTAEDLCFKSAGELAALIRDGKASAHEVMVAHLRQIARCNPKINAVVTKLDDEMCLALADAADRQRVQGARLGPLHGLPIAIKDLGCGGGFSVHARFADFRHDMPTSDSVIVERLRRAGALLIGKTNTPEFGMGSHTFNAVYGPTLNPYD